MYRAYLVSTGFCTGVPAIGVPADYRELDHLVTWVQLSQTSTGRDLLNWVDNQQGRTLPMVSTFYVVNLYSCLPYLPAGAAFRLGRAFTSSPLSLMYLGRFTNLLFYLLGTLIAMRLLPDFQVPLAVLALMPMSLHQAASLSADAVTMAVAFVLTAYILRLALSSPAAGEPATPLQRSDYLLLLLCGIVSGLCKSDAGLMFLLLLIPGVRFPNRVTRWLAITGYIVLAYGTAAAWQYIDKPNGEVYATLKAAAGIYLHQNAAFIFEHPAVFLNALVRTTAQKGREYLQQFVGILGWLEIQLPAWITWGYLALLAVTAVVYRPKPRLARWQRILLVSIFLLNALSLLAAFWITETPRDLLTSSSYEIPIFGRYLIPFALLLMIAVSGIATRSPRPRVGTPALAATALALVLLANAVALSLVWNRYQAHSSTIPNRIRMALRLKFATAPGNAALVYDSQLVRRPGPNPEDSKVFLIHDGQKRWVMNGHWITEHGYRWPDDVNVIPAANLALIPEGPPIR